MKTNSLGLPIKESEELVNELNGLLSNYQIYYQNLRGLHWNIRGKRFFDLHIKFEELYNDSQIKIVKKIISLYPLIITLKLSISFILNKGFDI